MTHPLYALSPLDGRYAESAEPLRGYFSEFAFLRHRLRFELNYLSALSKIGLVRALTDSESFALERLAENFSEADALAVQAHEARVRHDVKAIEYFIQEQWKGSSLQDVLPWIHFGLTSEDANSVGMALALKESRDAVLLPALAALAASIAGFALQHRAVPLLARTHGQAAVPTTLGKEFVVYLSRLRKVQAQIAAFHFEAKVSGAVGNYNALQAAAPQVDWLAFSSRLISRLGLDPNLLTTQILPYDNWVQYFDLIRLANSILLDFSQDLWRYISDGTLKQAWAAGEVGSSTMPQKVNPIDFENAEGNLGLANALFGHYGGKLPVSRLQRDLSDSTVRRTFGAALGHSLVAWKSFQRGLTRIAADEEKLAAELSSHWEVVSEGAQILLRMAGKPDAYETLKAATRGQVLTEKDYQAWVASIDVAPEVRARLNSLSPLTYLGLAVPLVDRALAELE